MPPCALRGETSLGIFGLGRYFRASCDPFPGDFTCMCEDGLNTSHIFILIFVVLGKNKGSIA
jgi:hypothetical protein